MAHRGVVCIRSPRGSSPEPAGTRTPPGPAAGQGSDSAGWQTSYLTLDLAQPRLKPRAELALVTTTLPPPPVFLWLEDSPRLYSHDLPFQEAVASSDRLFAMLNEAQITFYDL